MDGVKDEVEADASQCLFHGNLILHLLPDSSIVPFVTAGVGLVRLRGNDVENVYEIYEEETGISVSRTCFAPNWGGGVKVFLN